MLVIISGVKFQRTVSKFTKRIRKLLSCVHDLHKYEIRNSRRSREVTAKKCTRKRDARAKFLFCQSKPIAFLPFLLRRRCLSSPIQLYGRRDVM